MSQNRWLTIGLHWTTSIYGLLHASEFNKPIAALTPLEKPFDAVKAWVINYCQPQIAVSNNFSLKSCLDVRTYSCANNVV